MSDGHPRRFDQPTVNPVQRGGLSVKGSAPGIHFHMAMANADLQSAAPRRSMKAPTGKRLQSMLTTSACKSSVPKTLKNVGEIGVGLRPKLGASKGGEMGT